VKQTFVWVKRKEGERPEIDFPGNRAEDEEDGWAEEDR
jgi:hypothetical protein